MAMQKCPVCEGRGTMPESFYTRRESTSVGYVTCKSCAGRGIVFSPESPPAVVWPPDPPKYPWHPPRITWTSGTSVVVRAEDAPNTVLINQVESTA